VPFDFSLSIGILRRTALCCVFVGCGFSSGPATSELLLSVSEELPVSVQLEDPLDDVLPDVELELLPLSMLINKLYIYQSLRPKFFISLRQINANRANNTLHLNYFKDYLFIKH